MEIYKRFADFRSSRLTKQILPGDAAAINTVVKYSGDKKYMAGLQNRAVKCISQVLEEKL